MSDYPTLTEMGIQNPDQISRYSLTTINNTDILRIVYKRKKGSFLPASRRYRFGRASKTIIADSGTRTTERVYEISPFVTKAVQELEQIVSGKRTTAENHKLIKEELHRLNEEVASRIAYIESLMEDA